ncbi:MAG TPA: lysylphosphatidylglycerol synthase transmembrane domain-containing protein [Steroidobacteraceae bacterium]|nr:lysylphosphatidylglycerol synthase transmembrane domain-containing protein [Steroidobacteraceae bacterium]
MNRNLLRLLISILCLWVLFATIADIRDVGSSMASMSATSLLIGLVVVTIDRCLMTFKWLLLLKSVDHHLPWWRGMTIYCTSTLIGSVLPSTAGSDVIRGVWATRAGLSGTHVAASILVERFTGFISVLLLGVVAQIYLATRAELPREAQWLFLVSICLFVAAIATVILALRPQTSHWLVARMPAKLREHRTVHKIFGVLDACRELGAERATLIRFFILTLAEQLLPVALTIALAKGLDLAVSPGWLFSGLMLSLIAARAPISIDGIGVFDALFASLMAMAGVPAAASVAITFVSRILQAIACAPWAIVALWLRANAGSPSVVQEAPSVPRA